MGARGPVGQREEALARPRSRKGKDEAPVTKGTSRPATIPHADPDWHPIAKKLWDSLKKSGQSDFYESSDWAFAYSLMDDLSHYKSWTGKRSGQMLQTIYSAMERLLVTEGDRRRVRIELHEPEPDTTPAHIVAIADYQAGLGVDA